MKVELDTLHEQQSNYGSSVANLVFYGGNPTFSEFCDFIAENSKDEWGEICVVKSCRLILQDNNDQVEYSYGKLKNKPKEEYADRRIKKGTCWYSWNNYSYYVELESEKQKPKPLTNADRIRAMTDEELAAHMVNSVTVALLRFGNIKLDGNTLSGYIDYWLDWLKQEVE